MKDDVLAVYLLPGDLVGVEEQIRLFVEVVKSLKEEK